MKKHAATLPEQEKRSRPPLKWAGGKYRLLDKILPALSGLAPKKPCGEAPCGKSPCGKIRRLVEPFVGSGAVFLNADYPSFLLCDLNADLINFYRVLVEDGESFIKKTQKLFGPETNQAAAFYELRARFNAFARPDGGQAAPGPTGREQQADDAERAALFLYLNRHAYNGLVRYNRRGEFNAPFGKYAAPYFPLTELGAVLAKSRRARLEFAVRDFRSTFAALEPGDLVYCDPPYVPLSATADFTAYTAGGFGPKEQEELARLAALAARNGNPVLLSNQATEFSRQLYSQAEVECFQVRRTISCDGAGRGKALELLAAYRAAGTDGAGEAADQHGQGS